MSTSRRTRRRTTPAGIARTPRIPHRLPLVNIPPNCGNAAEGLLDLVKAGDFREDLYYRLNVFPMTLPPLRARREDIPALARSFLARFAAEEGKRLRGLTAETLDLLVRYDWPGNVRQLENAMFRAVVLADGDELTIAEFPQIANQVQGYEVRIPAVPSAPTALAEPIRELVRVEVHDPHGTSLVAESGDVKRLEDIEAEVIRFALSYYRGRMSEVSSQMAVLGSSAELGAFETRSPLGGFAQ